MNVNPLRITDTVLRDSHQSLLATRMRTEDMLPVAAQLDAIGYHSLEAWGGATFDSCLRYLNEDPWERLRQLRKVVKKTKLQMLLRGQNLVGYRHYADDVVERFVVKARENGIDIFRIFDALNDLRNLQTAMRVAKREGGHVQAAISYTVSPVHSIGGFVEMAKRMAAMGADSICIKDMAGLLSPHDAYQLVKELKAATALPVQLHCHYTSGMASAAYLKASEAGVDIVDTAISSLAMGSSQPPTESIVAMLRGTERDTGLDLERLKEIASYFRSVRNKYHEFESPFTGIDTDVLTYQVPGGMISNLSIQLREQKALDRLPEVLREIPCVRADMGYPPLVTPTSQIVGAQASANVLLGQRYKMVSKEVKAYFRGLYGQPPSPVDAAISRQVIGQDQPVIVRPADLLPPEMPQATEDSRALAKSEEDVLSYALFPQVAMSFFELRERGGVPDPEVVAAIAAVMALVADRKQHTVPAPAGARASNGISRWRASARDWRVRPAAWRAQ